MQLSLDFAASPVLPRIRDELRVAFGPQCPEVRLDPLSQLIKSLISARTYDAVSWAVFARLRKAFPAWEALAEAAPARIEALIAPVTFADQKARQLPILLRVITAQIGDLDLGFLEREPLDQAMDWLRGLPGVGVMTAAATLCFSTLRRPALVVDGHVQRVAQRLGLVARSSPPEQTWTSLMALAPADWDAEAFFELHWLIKGLGQSICTDAGPQCGRCPLKASCPRRDVGVGRKVVDFRKDATRPRSSAPGSRR
jgi:endonuclease-3